MPTYSYIARTADGTLEKGTLTAASPEAAREKLRKKKMMVDELQEETVGAEPIGFAGAMPWTNTDEIAAPVMAQKTEDETISYVPLLDTLRLFAGWLLAWYAVVYLLGSFRMNGKLPFEIPFLDGLFESWLVLRFTFGTFLFLLLGTIHERTGRGAGKGVALGLVWVVLLVLFHLNA